MPIRHDTTKEKMPPAQVAEMRIELPEHVHLADDELAVVTRLVRTMRQVGYEGKNRYWLGPFIEWLLYLDTTQPDLTYVDPKVVLDALNTMRSETALNNSSAFVRRIRRQCPGIGFASRAGKAGESKNTQYLPESEEEQFYQILRLWRLEHPEPPKRHTLPKGRTQHEMDPDSDRA